MDFQKIDLSEFTLSGEGANAYSYDNISDSGLMAKIYNKSYPKELVIDEYLKADAVHKLGVPSPEAGTLVTDGERIGILFRRIVGKRSYARILSQEPDKVEEFSRDFAINCKKLHEIDCKGSIFQDGRKFLYESFEADKVLNPDEKTRVLDFLDNRIPVCTTALHGDMHFGNALTTIPAGSHASEPHDFYFIDTGFFAYGCPLIDVGMLDNICNFADDDFRQHDFHFGLETGQKAWKAFVEEYFFGKERLADKWFGIGAGVEEVNHGIHSYTMLKLLMVEYVIGSMPVNYIPVVKRFASEL